MLRRCPDRNIAARLALNLDEVHRIAFAGLFEQHPGAMLSNRVAVRPGVDLRGDGGDPAAEVPALLTQVGRLFEGIADFAKIAA